MAAAKCQCEGSGALGSLGSLGRLVGRPARPLRSPALLASHQPQLPAAPANRWPPFRLQMWIAYFFATKCGTPRRCGHVEHCIPSAPRRGLQQSVGLEHTGLQGISVAALVCEALLLLIWLCPSCWCDIRRCVSGSSSHRGACPPSCRARSNNAPTRARAVDLSVVGRTL